ncbi:hypothetical protein ZEAMMB73_Zm00001d050062 [Zea mays]|uniref:Uncharacterized protein n=1 Tax=Zea mays TaxID=4577 RepID=A0A1D6PZL2_MAIZE|nr:hypothetical protein ZEAMMB73_Zm00001d050062 [Zea mays]
MVGASLYGSRRSKSTAIVDQMYNDRNIFNDPEARGNLLGYQLEVANLVKSDIQYIGENRLQAQHPSVPLPCSVVQLRYYYILCGMGRSQWKDFVAVRFSKTTTINWEYFGLSIEPNGHCDNFFIAGFCQKHFEDVHPRMSKKHFFYPKVGNVSWVWSPGMVLGHGSFFLYVSPGLQV